MPLIAFSQLKAVRNLLAGGEKIPQKTHSLSYRAQAASSVSIGLARNQEVFEGVKLLHEAA
jgi:hypothetical protein